MGEKNKIASRNSMESTTLQSANHRQRWENSMRGVELHKASGVVLHPYIKSSSKRGSTLTTETVSRGNEKQDEFWHGKRGFNKRNM